jgi:hypothetical protein
MSQRRSPGGVAQWSSHLPEERKTWVHIAPGCMFFVENMASMFAIFDFVFFMVYEAMGHKNTYLH